MTKEMFNQQVIFLEGAYDRKFPKEALAVAWGLFAKMDDHLVGMGARRMVEEGEAYPSPTKWLKCVKAIEAEAREEQKTRETRARLDVYHQIPAMIGTRPPLRVEEVGAQAPSYPGMGLRQILAVRELEKAGMGHEEALREVGRRNQVKNEAQDETLSKKV